MKHFLTLLFTVTIFIGCKNDETVQQPQVDLPPQTSPQAEIVEKTPPQPVAPSVVPTIVEQPAAPKEPTPQPEATKPAPVAAPSKAPTEIDLLPTAGSQEGMALFNARCASCHGARGDKQAMNVSAAIGGWDAPRVTKALKGYQTKTYGKKLQALMTGQVSKLSDTEIAQLALHIQNLK